MVGRRSRPIPWIIHRHSISENRLAHEITRGAHRSYSAPGAEEGYSVRTFGHGEGHPDFVDGQEWFVLDPTRSSLIGWRVTFHPNRGVVEAAVSATVDGRQRSLHASRRLDAGSSSPNAVGPITLEASDTSKTVTATVDAGELGFEGRFDVELCGSEVSECSVSSASTYRRGTVTATLLIDGEQVVGAQECLQVIGRARLGVSARDGARHYGAPLLELPQFLRYELVLLEDDALSVLSGDEDEQGHRRTPETPSPAAEQASFSPRWEPGTRWCTAATIRRPGLADHLPSSQVLVVSARLHTRGLGIDGPEWRTGDWHDELCVGTASWNARDLDPTDVHDLRAISLVVARDDPDTFGLLDLVAVGPHRSSGLDGFTDGFSSDG